MSNLRISSPAVLEARLQEIEGFNRHEWLFDDHKATIHSFNPDIWISIDTAILQPENKVGYEAKLNRIFSGHADLFPDLTVSSPRDLTEFRFATISNEDDIYTTLGEGDTVKTALKPKKVFRVNNVLGAEKAVKMQIGYAALPEFIFNRNAVKSCSFIAVLPDYEPNDCFLRIFSELSINDKGLALQKSILTCLTPIINTDWTVFGHHSNIVEMKSEI